ncbi:MAG TPA: SRPBCC domain-containing protein [Bacteroidota bacterium]|nr:SRPBCC domain-containing protein [Bacteroidota bacterium]
MATIYHRIPIRAEKSKVFEALTTQEGFTHWWTQDCVVKPAVGFINEFRIGPDAHYRMKVILFQPGRSVEWKCLNQHDDWSGTQVSFIVTEKGEYTYLDMRHTGLTGENEEYGSINFQWGQYLALLKHYCEAEAKSGVGAPSSGPIAVAAARN